MAYVPDPTNVSLPDDTIIAETAAAEFRALKAYIASLLSTVIPGVNVGGLMFRDSLLINGEFNIWQRGAGGTASFVSPAASQYTADKWFWFFSGAGRSTIAQVAGMDAFSPFSHQTTVTTSSGALGAGDFYAHEQRIEGSRAARIAYGTANARTCSLSFVANFNTAGLHAVYIQNSAQNRSYVATFTVAPGQVGAATLYTVPGIPGDIAGTWLITNASIGVRVGICLAAGTNFNAPAVNSWQAGNFKSFAGCVNEVFTLANVVKLGRVRFTDESGCSPFVSKSFNEDLFDCFSYYEKSFAYAIAPVAGTDTTDPEVGAQQAAATTTVQTHLVKYKRPKIATATVVILNPVFANNQIRANGIGDWSGCAVNFNTPTGFNVQGTTAGTTAYGSVYTFNFTADSDL